MGINDRGYQRGYQPQFQWGFSRTWTAVNILMAINIGVFAVDILSRGFGFPAGIMDYLAVSWSDLLSPLAWPRFVSYGFAHAPIHVSITHILFNMFSLWIFGRTVEEHVGKTKFLTMYMVSVVLCSFLSVFWYRMLAQNASILGASGAVATVVIYFVFLAPDSKIYLYGILAIPAWILGLIFVVMNFFGAFTQVAEGLPGGTAYITHLIGAALGFLFFRFGVPGGDWLGAMQQWNKRRKFRVVQAQEEKEQKVAVDADAVLDKVHREGYDSLSTREKAVLEKYSRQIKDKN